MNQKQRLATLLVGAVMLGASVGCAKDAVTESKAYDYDLSEYIKPGTYLGVEIDGSQMGAQKIDLDSQVMLARSNYATVAEKQGAAVLTDQLNISYVGTMDGVAFEGGTDDDCDITLGSGMFIDGFETGLVGAKTGDTVTLNLKFPDPYPNMPSYSGKDVTFTVTVNHVYEQILPPYTDEFVKNYYGYDNIEAFETALQQSIDEQYESSVQYFRVYSTWEKVKENAEVLSYPTAEYNALYTEYAAYYNSLAQSKGISLNEYADQVLGMTVKEFNEWMESEIQAAMKEEMLIYHIARTENITVSDAEYASGAEEYAQYYGYQTVEELEAEFGKAEVERSLLYDKVLEYLADAAVVK